MRRKSDVLTYRAQAPRKVRRNRTAAGQYHLVHEWLLVLLPMAQSQLNYIFHTNYRLEEIIRAPASLIECFQIWCLQRSP